MKAGRGLDHGVRHTDTCKQIHASMGSIGVNEGDMSGHEDRVIAAGEV